MHEIRAYTSNAVRNISDAMSIHTDDTHVCEIQINSNSKTVSKFVEN